MRKRLLHSAALAGLLGLGCPSHAQETATISIDAKSAGVPVNDKIFGHFMKGADNYGIFSIPYPDLASIQEGDGIWNPETKAPYADALAIIQSYKPGALRYPDGLPIHNHDWKKTIGPVEERGDRKFGINEFMQISEKLKSEPIFVVSEYIGTPQDAADLVEYLNMPAEPRYPWAQRRAADGHPEPYNVMHFEIGNESWVDWRKIGKPQVRPPVEVGRYASEVAAAMKKVDPRIRCGVPFENENTRWNREVFQNITPAIDFAIIHTYPVKYGGGDLEDPKEGLLLEAMMGAGYTTLIDLEHYRKEIKEFSGRDMPIAITEYNVGPTQQAPNPSRPYRYSLAAAVGTGDYLGRLLDPKANVETAIYWSWLNGFFEAVHTYAGHPWKTREKLPEPLVRPVHYVFQLWARYRGETLLPVQVEAPRLEFPGLTTMKPALGDTAQPAERLDDRDILDGARIIPNTEDNPKITRGDDGEWTIRYDKLTGRSYPSLMIRSLRDLPQEMRPPLPGLLYHISFEARWEPDPGSSAANLGLGVMDSRGWQASGSAIAIRGLQGALEWTKFTDTYQPLPDTEAIAVLARVEGGTQPISGTLRVRNLRIEPWRSATYPARPSLSAYATRSADGKKLHLLVFNMSLDRDIATTVTWEGFQAGSATYSELNGVSANATNRDDAKVGWSAEDASLKLNSATELQRVFPAHSATGITLDIATP
jgi:alpha-N-arabinofuranosidase